MILSRYVEVGLISLLIGAPAALNGQEVVAIRATVGGPFTVAINDKSDRQYLVSSNLLILRTLLPALVSRAKNVKVDPVPDSNVIKRVQFFEFGGVKAPFKSSYKILKIATERKADGTDEHLVVYLKKEGENEKNYKVYDPFLQQILIAAFRSKTEAFEDAPHPVDVQFDGDDIATVTLGENFK